MRKPSRLIVISDLHLGGDPPAAMSQPGKLASFIDGLPQLLAKDEALDLVIAGDFVDFLAVPPFASWTPDQKAAVDKLSKVAGKQGEKEGFAPVFDALGRHVDAGHRLTVMLGNHDLELALPKVRQAFLQRIGASAHDVHFVFDGSAYRVGGALIEHGNRYDNANANDFTGLRALASVLSRGEEPGKEAAFTVSTGSELVMRVVSPLKRRYPFVDLLKPEGVLLLYLVASIEPSLVTEHLGDIPLLVRAKKLAEANAAGAKPGDTANVAAEQVEEVSAEVRAAFPELAAAIRSHDQDVGALDQILGVWSAIRYDSLSKIVQDGGEIDAERLGKIRVSFSDFVKADRSFDRKGPDGPYAKAAERLLKSEGVETVVMGHTHLARHHGPLARATYINTGTWADLVTIPADVLKPGSDAALRQFLIKLVKDDQVRSFWPTYADVRVNEDGRVVHAALQDA